MNTLPRLARLGAPLLLAAALLAGQWLLQAHALAHHHADENDDGHAALCLHCLTLAAAQVLPPPLALPAWLTQAAPAVAPGDAVPMGLTFAPPIRPRIRAPPAALPG